ncbi:hypothetical protein QTO02_10400, partial [Vibrio fortis]
KVLLSGSSIKCWFLYRETDNKYERQIELQAPHSNSLLGLTLPDWSAYYPYKHIDTEIEQQHEHLPAQINPPEAA